MRTIYLASDSKARKKLLNIFGLKFKVMPSKVNEITGAGRFSYSGLVKDNALAKARCVASRVKGGIVIAADTICVQGKKVFGKPKDLKDAVAMLKQLSSKPQWLYTGIAVVDKDNNKELVACEKTKVFMDRLSDSEISAYFAKVSPLDKAGSFDIQGRGAFFIRRIEGCFYNVVGLPLRRLYLMFKELGVKVLVVACCVTVLAPCLILSGCSTEYNLATKQEEAYMYSTDREVKMGQSIDREVAKDYKFTEDPLVQKRVEDVGKKIAAVCDRRDIDYHFKVLQDDEVNAVSLPGGYIYVNSGLVEKVDNDDQLAGVLAHEVGHIVARHSIKKLQAMMSYNILRILTVAVPGGAGPVGSAADSAFAELLMGYSREDELLADELAARYMKLAGYNPQGMIDFLKKLQYIDRRKPLQPKNYFKTHPYVPDRIRVVKEALGQKIGFNDYINIEQKPHGE